MDPFTEQAQSDNYNNSPAIDMTRGGVFEKRRNHSYRYSRWIRQV
jgi:hypothetical protein